MRPHANAPLQPRDTHAPSEAHKYQESTFQGRRDAGAALTSVFFSRLQLSSCKPGAPVAIVAMLECLRWLKAGQAASLRPAACCSKRRPMRAGCLQNAKRGMYTRHHCGEMLLPPLLNSMQVHHDLGVLRPVRGARTP